MQLPDPMYVTGTKVENSQILMKQCGSSDGVSHRFLKKSKLEQVFFVFPHFPEIARKHMLHFIISLQGIFKVSGDKAQAPIHRYWPCN